MQTISGDTPAPTVHGTYTGRRPLSLDQQREKMRAHDFCGYIGNGGRTFEIHDQDAGLQLDSSTTLRQTFEAPDQKLELREKIQLGLAISAGTLHQHDTRWMAEPLTLDDVVLLQEKLLSLPQTHNISLQRPFCVRPAERAASNPPSMANNHAFTSSVDLAVLSLGTMLAK